MKARKILWKTETIGSFGSQTLIGRAGRIKVFLIAWSVNLKEYEEVPYILQSYLIPLKKKRFKTEEEAKKYAIKGFCDIVSELTERS